MQKLTKKLKEELYEELGFRFNVNNTNYEDILETVELGEKFNQVCVGLDLVAAVVEDYVKKYVLQLIIEEATNFSQQEERILGSYFDEPLVDTTIGKLFEQMQTEIHIVHSESFQSYITETFKFNTNNKEDSLESGYKLDGEDGLINFTYPFKERENTLFPIYYKLYVDKQRIIKPRPDKILDIESFHNDLVTHYYQYIRLLNLNGSRTNPTKDILELERETDILFLLKVWSFIPQEEINRLSKKDKRNYLKVIASFSLIEDIRLKLYLAERIVKENNSFPFIKGKGYIELFIMIFLYVPLLKEYLVDKIVAPKGILSIKSEEVFEKEEARILKGIKNKLFLYQALKDVAGYKLTDLEDELGLRIEEAEINYSEDLIDFYKKVKKVNGFRRGFSEESIDHLFEIIRLKPESLEEYLSYVAREFVTKGLALEFDKDSGLEKALEIFRDFEVNSRLVMEKFNNANIDIEKLFEEKI
ncbi:hypothetical protein ACQCT5_19045 [Sutcliffiella halmapala]